MTEVDEKCLKKGYYYCFFKQYKEYRPDLVIGEFVHYDPEQTVDHTGCATLKNSTYYIVDGDFTVRVEVDDDYVELSCEDHADCWVFELDSDEINMYCMELV